MRKTLRFTSILFTSFLPVLFTLSLTAQSLPPHPPAVTTYFPFAEVHRGLHGVAYTVFEGVNPEPMDVEILGLLKDSLGPGQDMILARLHGAKPEYTGVVAGMSGSPVYIDGKLLGALSFRIGQFSKDPIAGITPIAQMLEVRDTPASGPPAPPTPGANLTPIETPITFSGITQDTLDLFADRFRAQGMTPVASLGGADSEAKQPEPIVPGSAVSAVILRGDMSSAATCTVTYVDPTRLLACGHPFLGYGAVDFPMTKTDVVATLSSPANSFKIVNTTETVGAFTEDRSSAILGVFGHQARMIPIAVTVSGLVAPHTFHYEVVDNPSLTPNALLVSVYQSLHGTNRAGEETSYRVAGQLTVAGQLPVRMDALLAPTDTLTASIAATLYVNTAFTRIYSNTVDKPVLTGLTLQIEAIADHRSATLESATLSRSEAHPGDTVDLLATIRPWQGITRQIHLPLHLPDSLPEGPVRIVVADSATLDRLTEPQAGTARNPPGLADTVASLNRRHPDDRLYAAVLDHAPQAVLPGGALPEVPVSVANILDPLKSESRLQLTGESVVGTASIPVGYALTGSQALTLTIR